MATSTQELLLFSCGISFFSFWCGESWIFLLNILVFVIFLLISLKLSRFVRQQSRCFGLENTPIQTGAVKMLLKLSSSYNSVKFIRRLDIDTEAERIVDLIQRDFIESWLHDLSTEFSNVDSIKNDLSTVYKTLFEFLKLLDKQDTSEKLFRLIHNQLSSFNQCTEAIKTQPSYRSRSDRSKSIRKYKTVHDVMTARNLYHPIPFCAEREALYLESVLNIIFISTLESKMIDCKVICNLVVLLLTDPIFSLLDQVSDSYWLHVLIIQIFSDEELEICSTIPPKNSTNPEQISSKQEPDEVELPAERLPPLGSETNEPQSLEVVVNQVPVGCLINQRLHLVYLMIHIYFVNLFVFLAYAIIQKKCRIYRTSCVV